MPAISIIIPVYNKRKYLSTMLDSVLQQSFSDFELITVDDGSTDDSGEILDSYALEDQRIKVHHIENGGVSHARNVGIDSAQGEYITFIDSDDKIADDYLENLYRCITENDVDLVVSGLVKTDKSGNILKYVYAPYKGKKSIKEITEEFAVTQSDTGIYGTCVAKIFQRELIKNIRFDESLKLAEDFDFYLRIYSVIETIYFDDQCLYYYLQSAENSTMLVSDQQIDYLSQLTIQLRFKEFLDNCSAYIGKNKLIIENKIAEYCYCAMRYADKEKIHMVFQYLYQLHKENDFMLTANGFRKKIVLCLLKNGFEKTEVCMIRFENLLRKIIRRG